MHALKDTIRLVVNGNDLTEEQMRLAMGCIMDGEANPAQIAAFLTSLRMKGETVDEITGAVRAMRSRALRMPLDAPVILDTCGTGGDGTGTFNISTASAFVCAASGLTVAKHGNRAVSSSVGSADVLEALGCRIDLDLHQVQTCVEKVGIGFLFAPKHHSALRHAAATRKELGFRTVLNLLGPMTNPAGATHQLIGVFAADRVPLVAHVLAQLGTQRAMIVHGTDGLDEITLSGPTHAAFLKDGIVHEETIDARTWGFETVPSTSLAGGNADENAGIIRRILDGQTGPQRDIVVVNAGAAMWVGELVDTLEQGARLAEELIDSGKALHRLTALAALTQEV
jgi:anthranilate phosphoribosyltransferase